MRVRLVIGTIKERPCDLAGVLEMTRNMLGLSDARLRLVFKLEIGKTLSQFLREAKMAEAARLMKEYGLPIKDIAHRCGYQDVSNFYRDFRKVHRMTPRQLQASHLDMLCQSEELLSVCK
jgi:AraC-like DNA-binding protein